ncbi:MAG: hypothetical protein WA705_20210 [Candidatus Ozemobacteraceae bacterium]
MITFFEKTNVPGFGFGLAVGYDPRLLEDVLSRRSLSLRGRNGGVIMLLSSTGRALFVTEASRGPGPDRLLVERLPEPEVVLPIDDWSFGPEGLRLPDGSMLTLIGARETPSEALTGVRDFPGHLRRALRRFALPVSDGLRARLVLLAAALKQPLAESVEGPILRVIGFEPEAGLLPGGDEALRGMLLTGRCFLLGKRLRTDWFGRLAMEIRRFQHRTTRLAAVHLRYAAEGRVTLEQAHFFSTMALDFEGAVEAATETLRKGEPGSGGACFLTGVGIVLDMVGAEIFGEHADPAAAIRNRGTRTPIPFL